MAPKGAHGLAEKLVREHPTEAVDILVSCCDNPQVYNDIVRCITSIGPSDASRLQNSVNITLAPQTPMSPVGSQHSGSSRQPYRLPHQSNQVPIPLAPLSPPGTASSITSHSSKDGAGQGEWVLFFTDQGGVDDECRLRLRTAHIKHSVIRQDVIHKRHLVGNLISLPPAYVSITRSATPLIPEQAQTNCAIELEWRRPHSERSHCTTFYIVSGEALDADVLLGRDDHEAGHLGMCHGSSNLCGGC